MAKKKVGVTLDPQLHGEIKSQAALLGLTTEAAYDQALRGWLGHPANRTDQPEKYTRAEKRAIERLLWIIRSKHEKATKARAAVLENIDVFYDYLQLAEDEDRRAGRKGD